MHIGDLFNKHKLVRRLALVWACWLITVVVLRVTDPAVIVSLGGTAAGTIVVSVIGILATVIGLYQHHRSKDV